MKIDQNGMLPESYAPAGCDNEQFRAVSALYLYPTAVARALDERQR